MADQSKEERGSRLPGVTIVSIVNGLAAPITLGFWILVYLKLFDGRSFEDPLLRTSAAATLGFGVGDLLWALPLLIISAIGLWNRREWGLISAQMVNVLWIYSMTVIWVRDLFMEVLSPGALLFTPFALFAIWACFYLWRQRREFA